MVSEDQRQQVWSYLQSQAAKLSTEELLVKRQTEVDRLLAEAGEMTEEQAAWAPEGEWSALQILQHVVDSFGSYRQTISRLGSGREIPGDQPGKAAATVPELSRAIQREHGKTQKLLLSLGDVPADRRENSDLFGDLNWREWALFERVHLLDHVNQIRSLKERATR